MGPGLLRPRRTGRTGGLIGEKEANKCSFFCFGVCGEKEKEPLSHKNRNAQGNPEEGKMWTDKLNLSNMFVAPPVK